MLGVYTRRFRDLGPLARALRPQQVPLYDADTGREQMVFRGRKLARSDGTPLARQFQEGLLSRISRGEPCQDYVRHTARALLAGGMDDQLVYRKQLRHRLDAYLVNVPPQVRAARLADAHHASLGRPAQYRHGGWIRYVVTRGGPEPLEARCSAIDHGHYLTRQLQPIADAVLQPLGESLAGLTTSQQALF